MSHYFQTEGYYVGLKTGHKKNSADGEQWVLLKFKVPEMYKGSPIAAETLSAPNLSGFPEDSIDYNSLQVNQKCKIGVTVSARVSNGRAFPEYRICRVEPK